MSHLSTEQGNIKLPGHAWGLARRRATSSLEWAELWPEPWTVAGAIDVELSSIHFLNMKMTAWVPVPPGPKFYLFMIVIQIMDSHAAWSSRRAFVTISQHTDMGQL